MESLADHPLSVITGIDVGGTFTDLIAFNTADKTITALKVPSTPENPADAIVAGLVGLDICLSSIKHLVHGTTVGTNAILERRGAKLAIVTTAGFRDVIEIGRGQRMLEGGLFNPRFMRAAPLVPRSLRFEVRERLRVDGSVLEPFREEDLLEIVPELRDARIEGVAICFLHSYRNGIHEARAAELLRSMLPELFVCLSHEVLPEYREFERFSTAMVNAYVAPKMSRYLAKLETNLRDLKFQGSLFTMSSHGGILSVRHASTVAVETVFSGPVGGVQAAVALAHALDVRHVITYDMGGTSTESCLIRDRVPLATSESIVAGLPIRSRQIEVNTIGAGGGSIAYIENHALQVGPRSAGAMPGPACYGHGGTEPTVTDANLMLGRIGSRRLFGGSIHLDRALAEQAVESLARKLEIDPLRLADGIVRLAVARMTTSIRAISVSRGVDPRDFLLVAFGGAGPMHAAYVGEELELSKVLIPRHPGNFSALGLLAADLRREFVQTVLADVASIERGKLRAEFESLEDRARRAIEADGAAPDSISVARAVDIRYVGQAFELTVGVDDVDIDAQTLRQLFDRAYLETYGRTNDEHESEIVSIRLTASAHVEKPEMERWTMSGTLEDAVMYEQDVYHDGETLATPFYDRERIPSGVTFKGPAIVEEVGSTTVIPPRWNAVVDTLGNIILEAE